MVYHLACHHMEILLRTAGHEGEMSFFLFSWDIVYNKL